MTDRKDRLIKLLAVVEAGTLWRGNVQSVTDLKLNKHLVFQANHGSLDAAKALHEAVLPEWDFSLGPNCAEVADYPNRCGVYFIGTSSNPARAWLIAILKAIIAGEDTNANDKGED
jgi:hypothetical protein